MKYRGIITFHAARGSTKEQLTEENPKSTRQKPQEPYCCNPAALRRQTHVTLNDPSNIKFSENLEICHVP